MRELRVLDDPQKVYAAAVRLALIDELAEELRALPKQIMSELKEEGDQIYG